MYVITSSVQCVINGLTQVRVYETREQAEAEWIGMVATRGSKMNGFTVQEVHYVKEGK